MTQEQLRMQMLAGIITEGEYKAKLNENEPTSDWRRSAEELMNVEPGSYDDDTFDEVVGFIYDATGYGVEGEDELKDWVRRNDSTGEYSYIYADIEGVKEENAYDDPIKLKAEERYKHHKTVSILGLGKPFQMFDIIPKGKYTIVEGDEDGRYFYPRYNVTLSEPMKPFDLAVQLAQKTGWISPWNYLEIRKGYDPEAKSPLLFPLEPTLF
jgi:hypothetical protein